MRPDSDETGVQAIRPHFDALFEKSLDAVVGMDLAGRIIAWNSSATLLFGWSDTDAIGALMSEMIIPTQHRNPHEQGLSQYRKTKAGPVLNNRVQITAVRRDGEEFPIELSILPIPSGGSTVFYGFIRSREDEERVNQEREIRAREAEVLAAISAAHMENLDTDTFIRFCLERICHLSGWSVAHCYRFDTPANPKRLVPTGVWYISDPQFQSAADITKQFEFARGEGMPGRVWETDAAMVIDDFRVDETCFQRKKFIDIGLTKGFAFPLRNCGRMSGVMEFFGPASAQAEHSLIRFADIVGSHVELALQRKSEMDMREMLQRELSHRVGNSLAVLNSLFRRCCESSDSVADLRARFEPRLMAVGHAHKMIASQDHIHANLRDIVTTAVNLMPEAQRVTVEGPHLSLDPQLVLPLTLILHELVTNSVKYGIWHQSGALSVTWSVDDDKALHLIWRETPATRPDGAPHEGYGTVLMRALAEGTMGGTMSKSFEDGAYVARLDVPLI